MPILEPTAPPGNVATLHRSLTAEDLAALPTDLPSGPVSYELGDGHLVVLPEGRLLTAADLDVMPDAVPSGPVLFELDNGRLIAMPPAGDEHGAVEALITTELIVQGDRRNFGKTRSGEVGVILWRDPDKLVGADAVFVANPSLPIRLSKEGYLETLPDLAVEVKSKNDTGPEVQRKVDDYLAAGVRVVWVADPAKKTVTAHRAGQGPQVFTDAETLTIEDVIPGFRVAVGELFQT